MARRKSFAWATALVAMLVCLLGNLGAIGLLGPDEPRYAWIARAMAQTGDWVTPRLYGQSWFEKPILYYWAAGAGFLLHLPAEWAARLPSALAALAAAMAVGWLGSKHYGGPARDISKPALLAPLVFSISVAAIGFARAATPDMLFSASLALAMASAATVLRRAGALRGAAEAVPTSRPLGDLAPLTVFGVFLGLAVLAKGPAGILLAGGAIALWALATTHWSAAARLAHPLAIAAFCIVALPWYIVCAVRNRDFLRIFLWQHNFERYLTPLFRHRQPFWFFGPVLLLALLPWTVLLWPAVQEGLRTWHGRAWRDSPGFFFTCWALFPVLFFSFSRSKLPGYILPAIPPLALVCSVALMRRFARNRLSAAVISGAVAVTWIELIVTALIAAHRIDWNAAFSDSARSAPIASLVVTGSGLLVAAGLGMSGYHRKLELVAILCAVYAALIVEMVSWRVLPTLDYFYSARPHAAFLRNDLHPDRIFTYGLSRSWQYGLTFYFRRDLPEWSPEDPRAALVLTTPKGLQEIRERGRFHGSLEERYAGILYVPIEAAPLRH